MPNPNDAPDSNAAAAGARGIWGDVRRQVIAAIVAGLIAGFVAAIGAIWAYLQTFVGNFGLVPKDAIVAFVGDCPPYGWDDYSDGIGKFIVGAGVGGKLTTGGNSVDLTAKAVRDQGGEEAHEILLYEMPAHNHRISSIYGQNIHDAFRAPIQDFNGSEIGLNPIFNPNYPTKPGWSETVHDRFLEITGGNPDGSTRSQNNMPPYIALTWCKRTG